MVLNVLWSDCFNPRGGSFTIFIESWIIDIGITLLGNAVKNNLKEDPVSTISSIFFSNIVIKDFAKWQFCNKIHFSWSRIWALSMASTAIFSWPWPKDKVLTLSSKSLSSLLHNLSINIKGSAPGDIINNIGVLFLLSS